MQPAPGAAAGPNRTSMSQHRASDAQSSNIANQMPQGLPQSGFSGNAHAMMGNEHTATSKGRHDSTVSDGKRPSLGSSTAGMGDGETKDEDGDDEGPGPSHKRKGSTGDDGQSRVQLACYYCRNKRIRCSGEKPICSACVKANVPCEWPSGRRKKRTRKEMEEAKRAEAAIQDQLQAQQQNQDPGGQLGSAQNQRSVAGTSQSGPSGQSHMTGVQQNQPTRSLQPLGQLPMGQNQGINPSAIGGGGFVGSGTSNAGNASLAFGTGGLDGFNFDSDENNSYSDLAAFDPSTFWSFPSTSTFGNNGPNAEMGLSGLLASGTNMGMNAVAGPSGSNSDTNPNANINSGFEASAPTLSNYLWPAGFTPESNLAGGSGGQGGGSSGGGGGVIGTKAFSGTDSNPGEPLMAHFMSQSSPATDMRLINALENQAAFIQGNPGQDEDLELFYYRFSGSTAIQPGIHRVSLKLQRRTNAGESPMTAAPQPESDDTSQRTVPTPTRAPADLFDSTGMPHQHVWQPLFEVFLANMSQHFPSVSRQRMQERFDTGTMSQFLANCICAVGARFASDAIDRQTQACAPFIAKAQELIIPLVHLPTTETTTGLIFLAWANFGQNSESGLWQYSGMAIRMSIDLGIHENMEVYESPAHIVRTRLLFWTLFVTDRIVAFATGRPASIAEDIIEIPLPEDQDFFPDPARNTPGYPVEQIQPVPFVYFVRLMIICGRISNVLNGRRGRARTLVSTAEPLSEQLAELQMRLVQFVAGLPESLRWSADNFKHQHNRGHGGCFLALHLWSHAVLALIYHPELLKSPSGIETPLNRSMNRNVKLSLASSRQICECMVFADLVAPNSYTSTPFLVQPLYVASMAIIHEMRAMQAVESTGNPTDMFLISMARQNLTALLSAVNKMEQFWAGTGYVANILEKRSGFKAGGRAGRRTFISLPDTGLLKRFTTDKQDPRDVAPATDTSLRESIAKSERNNPSPYWLADLMAGYTVENIGFTPADSFDLQRLLGGDFGSLGAMTAMGQMPQGMQGQGQGQGQ